MATGSADIDITELLAFHREQGTLATLTAVQPPAASAPSLSDDDDARCRASARSRQGDGAWINGGFFVCEPEVLDYIEGDDTVWEAEPMERLAEDGQLSAYRHAGFWQPDGHAARQGTC